MAISPVIIGALGATKTNFETSVRNLFANNEQGFFYDPNDLSTMFQESAGITPVTAVGQPVGIILDKSKGLVFGPELFNQVVNFSTWTAVSGGVSTSGNTFTTSGSGGYFKSLLEIGVSSTKSYQVRIVGTCTVAHMIRNRANTAGTFVTQAGDFDITVVAPLLFSSPSLYFYLQDAGTMTVNSISIKELAGNHAYQATSAQRPILRKNAVTGAYYLEFDGSDDFLATRNVDFTATDKISLFAGVRKLVDNAQMIAELSVNTSQNTGAFHFVSGTDGGGIGYVSMAVGTSAANVGRAARSFTYSGTDTAVLSVKHDISGDLSSMRRNGVAGINGTDDKGEGNFGNYPFYMGRRGGTSLPFSGHIYNLIGVGRLATENETVAIEKELAKRTGVTLNV